MEWNGKYFIDPSGHRYTFLIQQLTIFPVSWIEGANTLSWFEMLSGVWSYVPEQQ